MFIGHSRRTLVCGLFAAVVLVGAGSARVTGAQDVDGADPVADLAYEGQIVFGTSCVSCHDADGGDGAAPALNGHPALGAADHVVLQILRGNAEKGMPAFAANLDDRQVAAVATYIRTAWDNAHGVVLEDVVKRVRAASQPD